MEGSENMTEETRGSGMKFCENCGAELAPGAKFCDNCGQKIAYIGAESQTPAQTFPEETPAQTFPEETAAQTFPEEPSQEAGEAEAAYAQYGGGLRQAFPDNAAKRQQRKTERRGAEDHSARLCATRADGSGKEGAEKAQRRAHIAILRRRDREGADHERRKEAQHAGRYTPGQQRAQQGPGTPLFSKSFDRQKNTPDENGCFILFPTGVNHADASGITFSWSSRPLRLPSSRWWKWPTSWSECGRGPHRSRR